MSCSYPIASKLSILFFIRATNFARGKFDTLSDFGFKPAQGFL